MLSEFWKFVPEVCSVKVLQNNEQGVRMFLLHVSYLVTSSSPATAAESIVQYSHAESQLVLVLTNFQPLS